MHSSMHCNYCNRQPIQILADACAGGQVARKRCTFLNLMRRVNVTEGALYVATILQRQLQDMANNVHRWSASSQVLHLSVKALSTDFDGTARCMLRFTGIDETRQA